MPRQARLDAPGTLHHVMVRGIERTDLFRDDKDRQEFLSRMSELSQSTKTRIPGWTLMGNHVHLVLLSGPEGLPRFMRRLLTEYVIWFNRRHQRTGHLFQNRYKSIVCEADAYLLALVRYVHLNPLRGGVVKSLEELTHDWSEGSPSYSLKILTADGQGFSSSSSWSREEIENLKGRVSAFLGLPTMVPIDTAKILVDRSFLASI